MGDDVVDTKAEDCYGFIGVFKLLVFVLELIVQVLVFFSEGSDLLHKSIMTIQHLHFFLNALYVLFILLVGFGEDACVGDRLEAE